MTLGVDRQIELSPPCNVVVRAAEAGTVVEALDPQVMVALTGRPELKPVADEVARRLARALAELTSYPGSRRHAMDIATSGAGHAGPHVSFRTTCGREMT